MNAPGPVAVPGEYFNPTRVSFGAGRLERLPEVAAELGCRRPAVVAGEGLIEALGIREALMALLAKTEAVWWEAVTPAPEVSAAQGAVDWAAAQEVDGVIGLGGGSALDTAKVLAAALPNGADVAALLTGETPLATESLPTILLPTTAGTGSEVTPWATLWEREAGRKHSLEGRSMFPAQALLDPRLTHSLPAEQTAATGMDALAHALEAYWNRAANPLSDRYALAAMELIPKWLPVAVAEPDNAEARARMLLAALFAGLAFSNTKTAAAHSLSYPMTLRFGVTHGQATGITLAPLLRYNAEANPARMQRAAQALGASDVEAAAAILTGLLGRTGVGSRLSELGIGAVDRERIVAEGYTPDRAGRNLREITPEAMRDLLEQVA